MSENSENPVDGIDFSLWTLDGPAKKEQVETTQSDAPDQGLGEIDISDWSLGPEVTSSESMSSDAQETPHPTSNDESDLSADDWVVGGEDAFSRSDLDEAGRCFESALLLDPINSIALSNLGVVHHTRGDLDQAERLYLKAAAFNETHADSYYGLAQLWCDRGNHGLALRYAARGLTRQPENEELIELATALSEVIDAHLTQLHPS
ncbi:MAG: tetratricopeptide repeat protein [Myxococcota bacterium]|nr:tetratricopeptide repeat protein [Myxococcota bacterium]